MKTDKKIILITAANIFLCAAAAIVGFIVLPESLIVQVTFSGAAGNVVPKFVGLLIPVAINIPFSILYAVKKETKYILISLISYLIFALLFIFNL